MLRQLLHPTRGGRRDADGPDWSVIVQWWTSVKAVVAKDETSRLSRNRRSLLVYLVAGAQNTRGKRIVVNTPMGPHYCTIARGVDQCSKETKCWNCDH